MKRDRPIIIPYRTGNGDSAHIGVPAGGHAAKHRIGEWFAQEDADRRPDAKQNAEDEPDHAREKEGRRDPAYELPARVGHIETPAEKEHQEIDDVEHDDKALVAP